MEIEAPTPLAAGPELTPLGKLIEVLRIGRGISKQHLARYAGTSRQQLWRVMTGKSDLTGSLRERLADVLQVPAAALAESYPLPPLVASAPDSADPRADLPDLPGYLAQPLRIEATLGSLPSGDTGRQLKRALLNSLEEAAATHGVRLEAPFFELRRRVLAGEL